MQAYKTIGVTVKNNLTWATPTIIASHDTGSDWVCIVEVAKITIHMGSGTCMHNY